MATRSPVRRRDTRYTPSCGTATMRYKHPGSGKQHSVLLTNFSVAGVAFEIDTADFLPGMILPNVVVRIGHCRLDGDFVVKNIRDVPDARSQVGGLFYPESEEVERMVMGVIAGIETVCSE